MEDFETDEAPEHDPAIAAMMAKAEGLVPSDDDWKILSVRYQYLTNQKIAMVSSVLGTSTRILFE